jgi:hypothetical protein
LQKLEHCLKALVRIDHLSGPQSTVDEAFRKRISKTAGYTLGKAVKEWLRIAELDETPRPTTQDLFDPWVSISFGLPIDQERLTQHRECLDALARERNNLVHHELANFDFDSDKCCRDLVVALDSQNERIIQELNFIGPAIKGLIELGKWTGRAEFQDELIDEVFRQTNSDRPQ